MTKKQTILCIVGASGSGKTMASLYLRDKLGVDVIVSYTTRPMRSFETNGVEHWFVSDEDMPPFDDMIAYTYFGGYHYWASISQVVGYLTVYVIDEKGVEFLKERFSDKYNIISIFVEKQFENDIVDDERKRRDDERVIDKSSYDHVVVNKDKELFLEEMTKTTECILKEYSSAK